MSPSQASNQSNGTRLPLSLGSSPTMCQREMERCLPPRSHFKQGTYIQSPPFSNSTLKTIPLASAQIQPTFFFLPHPFTQPLQLVQTTHFHANELQKASCSRPILAVHQMCPGKSELQQCPHDAQARSSLPRQLLESVYMLGLLCIVT